MISGFRKLPSHEKFLQNQNIYAIAKNLNKGFASTIVLDLDDTVLYRKNHFLDSLALYCLPHAIWSVGVPYSDAISSIKSLASNFRIVAVTARWHMAASNTEKWFEEHSLTGLPLITATRPHPGDTSRIEFKSNAIKSLSDDGWDPIIGVGDRPSDMASYVSQGMEAIMVLHHPNSIETTAQKLTKMHTQLQSTRKESIKVTYVSCRNIESMLVPGATQLVASNGDVWKKVVEHINTPMKSGK